MLYNLYIVYLVYNSERFSTANRKPVEYYVLLIILMVSVILKVDNIY